MSEEKVEEKKLNEINIDSLIKDVYKKIAEWHNDDSTSPGLKVLVLDIIKTCTENTVKQLGLSDTITDVKLDEEVKKEALKKKQEENSTK